MYNEDKSLEDLVIKKKRKDVVKFLILFNIAESNIKCKNNRQRKNLDNLYIKLSRAQDIAEKKKIQRKINNAIKDIEKSKTFNSSAIEKEIETRFKRNDIKIEYGEAFTLASRIANDPIDCARGYLESYIINSVELDQLLRREKEVKKSEVKQQTQPRSTTTYPTSDVRTIYTTRTSTPEKKPELYSSKYLTDEEKQKEINENIIKKLEDPRTAMTGLTYEQKQEIRDAYTGYGTYSFADIVAEAFEMNRLSNKYSNDKGLFKKDQFHSRNSVYALMELAVACYHSQIQYLLNNDGFGNDIKTQLNSRSLMRKLKMGNSIEIYTQAYNNYIKQYNALPREEQEKIKNAIKTQLSGTYEEVFHINENNPRLVTPEELKMAINNKIIDSIRKWGPINSRNQVEYYSKLSTATRLMSVDQLVSLYNILKNQQYNNNLYSQNEEEIKRIQESRNDSLKCLQDCFASLIARKINVNNQQEMTEEQSKINEMNKIAVCKDYFGEEPLFNLYYVKASQVKEGSAKTRGEFTNEIEQARQRFYGMNKLQRTIAKVTGSYAKLNRLAQKEEVTEKDIEEARKLF